MLREALSYIVGLGNNAEKVQVLEICGETYANKRLERYGAPKRASAIEAAVPVCYGGLHRVMLI